jgi:hypothetical protein
MAFGIFLSRKGTHAVRDDDWRFVELAGNVSDLLSNVTDSAL